MLPAARSCAGLLCLPGAWGAAGEAVPLPRFNEWRGRLCKAQRAVMASLSETIVNTIQVWPARPSRARPCQWGGSKDFLSPGARRPLAAGAGEVDEA